MKVELECYCNFHDVTKRGLVTDVDCTFRRLKIDDETIYFEDIYWVSVVD
jgi:hypothetical protein